MDGYLGQFQTKIHDHALKFQSFDIQEPVCVFDPPPLYTISETYISSGRFY